MVTITFKLTTVGTVELKLSSPQQLSTVVAQCARKAELELGGIIAVRQGTVMSLDDIVDVNDSIDVFPAIAGG